MKYIPVFEESDGVRAFFSTREGAVEGAPYDNEDVFKELGLEDAIKVRPVQIHEDRIESITHRDVEALSGKKHIDVPDTDGCVTNVKGVLLTTVHADCLPVYFYDPKNSVIGLSHAGWRGALAGIVPQTLRRMLNSFGASRDHIQVFIGPGIDKCCFQVGEEVASQFLLEWGFLLAEPDERIAEELDETDSPQKYLLDLKGTVKRQLINAGLPEENIKVSEHCTCCEPETFCSYRREGGTYLRMGAGICMMDAE